RGGTRRPEQRQEPYLCPSPAVPTHTPILSKEARSGAFTVDFVVAESIAEPPARHVWHACYVARIRAYHQSRVQNEAGPRDMPRGQRAGFCRGLSGRTVSRRRRRGPISA